MEEKIKLKNQKSWNDELVPDDEFFIMFLFTFLVLPAKIYDLHINIIKKSRNSKYVNPRMN